MYRTYAVNGNCVNTQSTTLPVGNIIAGGTTVRPAIFDMTLSSDTTPADAVCKIALQRCTTAGTWAGAGGAAITPDPLDSLDTAATALSNQGVCSAGPTLTAGIFLFQAAVNQRATFRWVAAPGSELWIPSVANNGIALVPLVTNGTPFNQVFSILYRE
jgi:hypothetical protein